MLTEKLSTFLVTLQLEKLDVQDESFYEKSALKSLHSCPWCRAILYTNADSLALTTRIE